MSHASQDVIACYGFEVILNNIISHEEILNNGVIWSVS